MNIRPTERRDIPALTSVLDATELFPSALLPEMLDGFLGGGASDDIWLTVEQKGDAIGFCYAAPEALAEGTWNMLAIAVHPDAQGGGAGSALVAELERRLRADGQRILIADTSGTDDFADTRRFYAQNGYSEEARIRDFWAAGDDKVVFWKSLPA
ncbi:MAG: GNAT family N-acetyltransferase [Pseudomonadota bacterium]